MHRFRAGIAAALLATSISSPFIASAQVGAQTSFNQFTGGCHQITAEETAGLKATGATIPSNGLFCDKDKPLLYGGCPESPYPYLQTKNKTGLTTAVSGLNSDFACRMSKLFKAADAAGINIAIGSGFRDIPHQTRLYNAYIACGKCGAPVAKPGSSKHNFGLAIDLNFANKKSPRDLAQCAAMPECKWTHENNTKFGTRFPMSYEPWHIEPSGTVNGMQQPLPQGGWTGDQSTIPYSNTGAFNPATWSPSMAPQPQQFSPLGATGQPSATGTSVPTEIGTSPTQTYDPNAYLPTNYNSIPLPTATSSIFTVPPPYSFPLSTSTNTGDSQANNYYERLQLLASSSQTGTSASTGSSLTGSASSTQLNSDLYDIDYGSSNTGGSNLDDNTPIAIATNSVAINPIHVTETFTGTNKPPQTTSTGLSTSQNQSIIMTLLTAVRDLLVSYVKLLKSQTTYGFQGAWQPAQSGAVYR